MYGKYYFKIAQKFDSKTAVILSALISKESQVKYHNGKDLCRNGFFFYMIKDICIDCNLNKKTIERRIKVLEENDLIEIMEKENSFDKKKYYRINHEKVNKINEGAFSTHSNGQNQPSRRGKNDPSEGAKTTPKLDINILNKNNINTSSSKKYIQSCPEGQDCGNLKKGFLPDKGVTKVDLSKIPTPILNLIVKWENLELHSPSQETKSYQENIKHLKHLLSGNIYSGLENSADFAQFSDFVRPYSANEIAQAMENFAEMVHNPEMKPLDKTTIRKLPICKFVLNLHASKHKSYFLKCMEGVEKIEGNAWQPKIVEGLDPKIHKKYVDKMRKAWYNLYRGTGKTPPTETELIVGANKYYIFFKKKHLNTFQNMKIHERMKLLMDALHAKYYGRWETEILTWDSTWNKVFYKYLETHGYRKNEGWRL